MLQYFCISALASCATKLPNQIALSEENSLWITYNLLKLLVKVKLLYNMNEISTKWRIGRPTHNNTSATCAVTAKYEYIAISEAEGAFA